MRSQSVPKLSTLDDLELL